ncbi:acyltransferase family protein [Singulisphaera sp. PoT]|uniref:acyltransferase family protein n=1 Tax=Singulisphaera sp. PoT TaxID=3411797 RepID=UPI003BF47D5B
MFKWIKPGSNGRDYPALVRESRYRLLDHWRGVACLMVVLHHAGLGLVAEASASSGSDAWLKRLVGGFFACMNLGVPLFFVISGYCIAASSDSMRRKGGAASRFLSRRIWRIYPPYWAAVAILAGSIVGLDRLGLQRLHVGKYAPHFESPGSLDVVQWIGNLTLTEEWRPRFYAPPSGLVYTRVAWSLCYEEQFYFVCFLALLIAPTRLYGTLLSVTIGVLILRVLAADIGAMHLLEGLFPSLWHEFAVGMAVYWRLAVASNPRSKRMVELGLVALAALGLMGYFPSRTDYSTAMAAAFGLILIALRDYDERADALRWLAPIRSCGRRCYSIYLMHFPIVACLTQWICGRWTLSFWGKLLVMVPVTSSAGVAFCWLFYAGVERHFLNPPLRKADRGMTGTTS